MNKEISSYSLCQGQGAYTGCLHCLNRKHGLGLFKNTDWNAVSNTISDITNLTSQIVPLVRPPASPSYQSYPPPQVFYQVPPAQEKEKEIPWGWIAAGGGVLFLGTMLLMRNRK